MRKMLDRGNMALIRSALECLSNVHVPRQAGNAFQVGTDIPVFITL